MKILDCTLRDGGYYTNWDFTPGLVDNYLDAINKLPIDYIEIGYRAKPVNNYMGEYYYLPTYTLERIKSKCDKKIAVMLNEKEVRPDDAEVLLTPCKGLVNMVRLAIDPKNFERAIDLAKKVNEMGFEVGLNIMYMSKWKEYKTFIELLPEINDMADYFYMVDSFGGVYPNDVKEIYNLVRSKIDIPIGFHGHNNLELALINTITAIECGVEMVDATILGMGRGAGNLKTELLLTALNIRNSMEIDFNALSSVLDDFIELQKKYDWGTSLPYMVSGANSLPQKQVMEWVTNRYYSLNTITRALTNVSKRQQDNLELPKLDFSKRKKYDTALIISGGPSVQQHSLAIKEFLKNNPEILVIHASSKNAMSVMGIENDQLFCLVGNEGYRLENVFKNRDDIKGECILPPYPRIMGTYVPKAMEGRVFELKEITFTDKFKDSHTAIALQTVLSLNINKIFVVGYDGYAGANMGEKEQQLLKENDLLFSLFSKKVKTLVSLTPTQYEYMKLNSIYALL